MAKTRTKYICQQCESQYPMEYGRCPNCNAWHSMVEVVERIEASGAISSAGAGGRRLAGATLPRSLARVDSQTWQRIAIGGSAEFNRVLGGGIVPGSLVLVGGDPGIGKSTLLLQIGLVMAVGESVLYVTGEEFSRTGEDACRSLGNNP